MNKFGFLLLSSLVLVLSASNAEAQVYGRRSAAQNSNHFVAQPANGNMNFSSMEGNGYVDQNIDCNRVYKADGMCVKYCPVKKYVKKNFCTPRKVCEPYTVEKQCCRYKPECYEVTHCRYVPQYYTTQHTRYVPETYTVCETRYKERCVYDDHCCYEPVTYYVKTCEPAKGECPEACVAQPKCCPQPQCCPKPQCCPQPSCDPCKTKPCPDGKCGIRR